MANQCIYNKNENVDILNVYVIDRDTFYIWLSKTDIFIHLTDRRQTFQVIHKDRNPILSQYWQAFCANFDKGLFSGLASER